MGTMGTLYWTLAGAAALVLAPLWADRIVRRRRAEATAAPADDDPAE